MFQLRASEMEDGMEGDESLRSSQMETYNRARARGSESTLEVNNDDGHRAARPDYICAGIRWRGPGTWRRPYGSSRITTTVQGKHA